MVEKAKAEVQEAEAKEKMANKDKANAEVTEAETKEKMVWARI